MKSNKENKKNVLAGLVIAVLALGAVTFVAVDTNNNQTPTTTQSQTENKKVDQTTISYDAKPGITSLQQLKDENKGVVTESSQYGEYVSAIGDYKGGDDGKYWSFYVDGKLSDVGAGTYVQNGNEKIVWKFQKL